MPPNPRPPSAGSPFVSELSAHGSSRSKNNHQHHRNSQPSPHHYYPNSPQSPHYYDRHNSSSAASNSWDNNRQLQPPPHAATKSHSSTSEYSSSMRNDRSRVVAATREYKGEKEQCCQLAKFDPLISLDCARVEGGWRKFCSAA